MSQQPNIFQEVEEDLERQRMHDLWKRYGSLIFTAALAVVIGTAGMTAWRTWQTEKQEKASNGLLTVLRQQNADPAKQIEQLQKFAAESSGTAQATFARIQAGLLALHKGDKETAVKAFDEVSADVKTDPAFRQYADVLSVEAQMDSGNPALLQQRLQPLMAENAPWRFMAMEFSAFLALKEGDKAKAKQLFTDLSQDASAPHTLSARAADMLRAVGE